MSKKMTTAVLIGLAGALSLATATGALAAKAKKPSKSVLQASASTESSGYGVNPQIPVEYFQAGGYRPGLCHIIVDRGRELGYWGACKAGSKTPGP